MISEQLQKSCMAFQLTDGKVLLIHDDDVEKLVNDFWTKMILDKRTHCYMIADVGLKRAEYLYKIYQETKKEMSEETKEEYLKQILLSLSSDNNLEVETLDNKVKKITPQQ